MSDKKEFVGRCGICDIDFYSREELRKHFSSLEHLAALADPVKVEESFIKSGEELIQKLGIQEEKEED